MKETEGFYRKWARKAQLIEPMKLKEITEEKVEPRNTPMRISKLSYEKKGSYKSRFLDGCRLCGKKTSSRRLHVIQNHYSRWLIFCPYCPHAIVQDDVQPMRLHVKNDHPQESIKVIDRRDDAKEEIRTLMNDCFSVLSPTQPRQKPKTFREGDCELCFGKKIVEDEQTNHVINRHLNKPLFSCNLCPFVLQSNEINRIQSHCRIKHGLGGNELPSFTNNRLTYQDEMFRLSRLCFPYSLPIDIVQLSSTISPSTVRKRPTQKRLLPSDNPLDLQSIDIGLLVQRNARGDCDGCGALDVNQYEHVLNRHVSQPLLECNLCPFALITDDEEEMDIHTVLKHAGNSQIMSFKDNRDKFRNCIISMIKLFFRKQDTVLYYDGFLEK